MTPLMSLMIVGLAIALPPALYVAWPLLSGRVRPEEYLEFEDMEPVLERLYFQRDSTYTAMKELEFDFAAGNLSEADFQQLQERYKRKAVSILKRIDEARAGRLTMDDLDDDDYDAPPPRAQRQAATADSSVELDVEQEIEAFRRRHKAAGARASLACPTCNRPVKDPDAAFCSKCGAPIGGGTPQARKRTSKSREAR